MISNKVISWLFASILLSGCGGSGEKSESSASISVNTIPIAHAGNSQNAVTGSVVNLDAEKSSDNDGDALTYQWSLIEVPEGSSVELNEFTSISPFFLPDIAGLYKAQLIVSDGKLSSEPSAVTINVALGNEAPRALAGDDIDSYVTLTVFLDGSKSVDPENSIITYDWSINVAPENSDVKIYNANTQKPQLMSSTAGEYMLQLTVTDEEGAFSHDNIVVTFNELGSQKDVVFLKQELIDNKAKWESQNINSYQIDQYVSCFCGENQTLPVTMQVQDKSKNFLYYTPNNDWPDVTMIDRPMVVSNVDESAFYSVNELFDYIELAISDAPELTVSYHPVFGYPLNVIVNWNVLMSDSDRRINTANLINLIDNNCEAMGKEYPNIKLNVIDEDTAEPINCDVVVDWQNSEGEQQSVVNDGFTADLAFGVLGTPIPCVDNAPILLASETGLLSMEIAKTNYVTKTVDYSMSAEERCSLIPQDIDVQLEKAN